MSKWGTVLGFLLLGFLANPLRAQPAPVLSYDFDAGAGLTVADKSGNGLVGQLHGTRWMKREKGFALLLDGKADYVGCGDDAKLQLPGPLTISIWIYEQEDIKDRQQYFVTKFGWNLRVAPGGVIIFETRGDGKNTWTNLPSKGRIQPGRWYHVAAVYDPATLKESLYLDGVLDAERTRTEGKAINNIKGLGLEIGRYGYAEGQYFKGMVDDFSLYAQALSAQDIAALYALGAERRFEKSIPPVVIHYRPLPHFIGENLVVNLEFDGIDKLDFKPSVEIAVRRAGEEKPLRTIAFDALADAKKLDAVFPASDMAPGDYELRAAILGRDKTPLVAEPFAIRRPMKYIGPCTAPSSGPLSPAPQTLTLQNESILCDISPASGRVTQITFRPRKLQLLQTNCDTYVFDGKDGKRVSEEKDCVTGYRKSPAGAPEGFELVCTNPELPEIELTKAYRLESDHLVKVTYFRALTEKSDGKLIFLRSDTALAPDFYKDGSYYRPMWDGGSGPGSGTFPFIPGASIKERTAVRDLGGALFIYVQPASHVGCAQYKFKVNGYVEGRFTTYAFDKNEIDDATFLVPSGWEMYFTGDVVRKGLFLSVESHFMVFDGDAREFHRRYKLLPEIAKLVENHVPDWYSKVKICSGDGYATLPQDYWWVERTRALLSTLAPNEYILSSWGYWAISGDYQLEPPIFASWSGYVWDQKTTKEAIKKQLDRYKQFDPQGRLKSILYTWPASASDKSKTYMEKHPEWLLRRNDGNYQQYGSDEVYNYLKDDSTKDHTDFMIDQFKTFMPYFELAGANMDGGRAELVTYFPEKRFLHLYHQTLFVNGIKRACEEQNRVFFTNGSTMPECQHGGFFEYGGTLQVFEKRDWRLPANVAFVSKYVQQPTGVACLLTGDCPAVSNRTMMYGLLPFMRSPSYCYNISHQFLVIDLAFEVRNSQIVDGDHIHPNWWNAETATMESALLKQGAGYLLPLINHDAKEKRETVSLSLQGLALDPKSPLYVWQTEPMIPFGLDLAAHIPESVDAVSSVFDVMSAKGDTLRLETLLASDRLKMVTISQTPAFVYSIGGRRNHLFLNSSRGVEITGRAEGKAVNLDVHSDGEGAEVLVFLEKGWKNAAAQVNGKPADAAIRTLGNRRFALLSVPMGASKVVVTEGRGAAAAESALLPPTRHPYEDFAYGFKAEQGKPEIKATTKDGLPCWEVKGPGLLVNMSIYINRTKSHKGMTFKLNCGEAQGVFDVRAGTAGKFYQKKIPLDFTGWKEFTILQDDFDVKPDVPFQDSPFVYFNLPKGSVYVSDFRLIPFTEADAAQAATLKIKRPQVVVPRAKSLPVLDGMLIDDCWKDAGRIEFAGKGGLCLTQVSLMYDDKNLYMAATCGAAINSPPSKLPRDSNGICKAENFEMYFMPQGSKMRYQLITNPAGAQWDGRYEPGYPVEDINWNPDWKVATAIGWGLQWRFEAVIPFASFDAGVPKKGDVWVVGLFRQTADAELVGWHGVSFHDPLCYGEFLFDGDAPK